MIRIEPKKEVCFIKSAEFEFEKSICPPTLSPIS